MVKDRVPLAPSSRTARGGVWRRRFLLLGFTIVFCLGAGEIVTRWALGPPGGESTHHRLFCEFDPILGWRKRPGQKTERSTDEYEVLETINAQGLRGPDRPHTKPEGVKRVLLLGDSFLEGYSVNDEENVCRVLEKSLAGTSASVEVLNGGTGGYSTDQELLFYREEGQKYGPDVVVLLFYENDVFWNTQPFYGPHGRGEKPLFELSAKGLVPTNLPLSPGAEAPDVQRATGLKGWLQRNSMLYETARRTLWKLSGSSKGKVALPGELWVWSAEGGTFWDAAWTLTGALMKQLANEVATSGAEFLVFYVPSRAAVDDDAWKVARDGYVLDASKFRPDESLRRLRDLCTTLKIDLVDPTKRFRRAHAEDPQYFPKDGHWNPRGHATAAAVLREELTSRRWVVPP